MMGAGGTTAEVGRVKRVVEGKRGGARVARSGTGAKAAVAVAVGAVAAGAGAAVDGGGGAARIGVGATTVGAVEAGAGADATGTRSRSRWNIGCCIGSTGGDRGEITGTTGTCALSPWPPTASGGIVAGSGCASDG